MRERRVIPGYSLLLVCVLPLPSAHEAAGAKGIRRSPRPLWAEDTAKPRAHCVARANACLGVIASAAKQSILSYCGAMDCFASLATTSKRTFTTSPRDAPEPLMNLPPKEGVGNAGCPWHPQPRVRLALVEMHTSKRVPRNHPTFPHAMVLTVSFVLSPAIGLVCHRRLAD